MRLRFLSHAIFCRTVLFATALTALSAGTLAADEQEEKPAKPEELLLRTGDDVTIAATYYAGSQKLGKQVVPIVLLHASKGSRRDFVPLALRLQQAGHAVIAPDLRGHGESTRTTQQGRDMRAADYQAMVEPAGDLETVKKFLMAKNNAGELNIEKLCVVGAEMGSVVALNWTARDWAWPELPSGKQGQDVKALVLISPEWTFRGLRINEALADPHVRQDISVMILVGRSNNKLFQEARRLHAAFERYHLSAAPDPSSLGKQTLWLKAPQTALQGSRLLNEKSAHVDDMILQFVDLRLTKQPLAWRERKRPLD
ncbi:MAG TPA: alpha/beta fold hydrolase [Pirellulales bacterium]|jgi:pimeloyl-ACP methyl ester carboxylesterase